MNLSIVVADDHPVVRRGVRATFETEAGLSVIGEATDGREAVSLVERLQPDVLILEVVTSGRSGFEALPVLRERASRTRVVVHSTHCSKAYVAEALGKGALGYVLKTCEVSQLVHAVREAGAGRRFFSPPVAEYAIDAFLAQLQAAPLDPHDSLTEREREVFRLAAEGKTSPQIAAQLYLSPRTVENHRARLLRKLGVKNQAELIRCALRRGIIPLE